MSALSQFDPEIASAIKNESSRQRMNLVLIASENYVSEAVTEAQSSLMTNKYAEGYPGRRYYGGCEFVDVAEQLAIDRITKLFHAPHANVQPHSGAQANMAVYFALLKPGDTVLGMRLDHGGHLTHGSKVSFSGKLYNFISYGVDRETEQIDYDDVARLAQTHRPKIIVAGASAYPRIIDFERFRQIADDIGAILMVDMAHIAGLIAAGVHPSCIPHAQVVTSTTHKTLRGPRGAFILCDEELASKIDSSVFPGVQGGPQMHTIAAKAVCFNEALTPDFADYGKRIVENAKSLATTLEEGGLRIVSGGTDNHLMLVDVTTIGTTGKDAEDALSRVRITANKNAIPFDTKPPRIASGIRLGTPAVTTRGLGPKDMVKMGEFIIQTLTHIGEDDVEKQVREEVIEFTSKFPVPFIND